MYDVRGRVKYDLIDYCIDYCNQQRKLQTSVSINLLFKVKALIWHQVCGF